MKMLTRTLSAVTLTLGAASLAPAHAAALWAGADLRTSGLDAHAGTALLPVPFIGTVGIEGGVGTSYSGGGLSEVRLGATLRDLNLPFTRTDGFVTGGAAYHFDSAAASASTPTNGLGLYVEGGLRGPLLGPVGWRAGVKADTRAGLSAGVGLEFRF
jgi:hypothetical protein